MNTIRYIIRLILTIPLLGCDDGSPSEPSFDTLAEAIDHIADEYVEVGAMIGVIDKDGNRLVFSYGTKVFDTVDPPDGDSVFEIGSITKTFTATLLADMFLRGELPEDEVRHYLPQDHVTMPTWSGIEITLGHLATHTSGLPRVPHEDDDSAFPLPTDFEPLSPFASYTADHVYDYLTDYCTLLFEPGTWWAYSNTGMGLLGHVLGLVDQSSYDTLLSDRLFGVLGMTNSSIYLTDQQQSNLAHSHNAAFEPGLYFIANDIYQGAGSIKSSLNDMFTYLEAQLGLTATPLAPAIALTHETQLHQGSLGDQGLAWLTVELDDGQRVTYHGGDTYGYSAYTGFNKALGTGAIVLLNSCLEGAQMAMGHRIMAAINKY